eukprot:GSA120T00021815001.1
MSTSESRLVAGFGASTSNSDGVTSHGQSNLPQQEQGFLQMTGNNKNTGSAGGSSIDSHDQHCNAVATTFLPAAISSSTCAPPANDHVHHPIASTTVSNQPIVPYFSPQFQNHQLDGAPVLANQMLTHGGGESSGTMVYNAAAAVGAPFANTMMNKNRSHDSMGSLVSSKNDQHFIYPTNSASTSTFIGTTCNNYTLSTTNNLYNLEHP